MGRVLISFIIVLVIANFLSGFLVYGSPSSATLFGGAYSKLASAICVGFIIGKTQNHYKCLIFMSWLLFISKY